MRSFTEETAPKRQYRECIVKGCTNKSDEGMFVGTLCAPCHNMLITGKPNPTDSILKCLQPWNRSTETPPPKDGTHIIGLWLGYKGHNNVWGTTYDPEGAYQDDGSQTGGWELQTLVTENDPDFWMPIHPLPEKG